MVNGPLLRAMVSVVAAATALLAGIPASAQTVAIDGNDIGGVVRSAKGAEAGVWVIAETGDLPTKFARSVVTDDQGRYVIPDLPKARYQIWVRGYGLADSAKVAAAPGQRLNLTATAAKDDAEAAKVYPAAYWYAMLKIPPASDFGPGNKAGIPAAITQGQWLRQMNNVDCIGCHQLGQLSTRTIPSAFGQFKSHEDAWMRRIQSGQVGRDDDEPHRRPVRWRALQILRRLDAADRQRRAAEDQADAAVRRRAQRRRHVVGVELGEALPARPDRVRPPQSARQRQRSRLRLAGVRDRQHADPGSQDAQGHVLQDAGARRRHAAVAGPGHAATIKPTAPSAYWGDEAIWDTRANNHNAMLDRSGRVWISASVRGMDNPAFCKKGSDHPSAKVFPLDRSGRQVAVFEPKTKKYTFVDTCFGTHHPQFGYDRDNTLWLSGTGQVAGWINTRVFDETGDAAKAQGWSPFVLDLNGNGRRDDGWTEPGKPEAGRDMRVNPGSGPYAVMPHPKDGSVWSTVGVFGGAPGFMRFDPKTQLSEFYQLPPQALGVRGGDIDANGVLWGSGSNGHLISFDRSTCKAPLNGPNATGNHCPEGFAFHRYPGPGFEGHEKNSVEASYYTWVDHHNVVGLGNNVPISTANLNDGFVALVDGKMVLLQVPFPLGFYAKGFDGRIDDPKAGWKGRGLWSTNGDRTPWLMEGGKGSKPRAVHIQVRPIRWPSRAAVGRVSVDGKIVLFVGVWKSGRPTGRAPGATSRSRPRSRWRTPPGAVAPSAVACGPSPPDGSAARSPWPMAMTRVLARRARAQRRRPARSSAPVRTLPQRFRPDRNRCASRCGPTAAAPGATPVARRGDGRGSRP